jgi:hypothetical protein
MPWLLCWQGREPWRGNSGQADAISFGRPFIADPDLPHRFANDLSLASDDIATWYTGGATGYADYPAVHALTLGAGGPTGQNGGWHQAKAELESDEPGNEAISEAPKPMLK